jgi:hypothetical protein
MGREKWTRDGDQDCLKKQRKLAGQKAVLGE